MSELVFSIKDDISMDSLLEDSNFDYQEINGRNEVVEGKIVDIQIHENEITSEVGEYAIISLFSKREGRISLSEFRERPVIGDFVKGLVSGIDKGTGLINISQTKYRKRMNWEMVLEAFKNNLAISCTIGKIFNNSYIVYVESIPMLLPMKDSHALKNVRMQVRRKVGDELLVKIVSLDRKKRRGIVSHKQFLAENKEASWSKFVKKYKEGNIVEGKLFQKTSYGIFIIIDEVLGLIKNEDITWNRNYVEEKRSLNSGDMISVKILSINPKEYMLYLGIKWLTQDPWLEMSKGLEKDQVVSGIVKLIVDYGVFLNIKDNFNALLHASEVSWGNEQVNLNNLFKMGQKIDVKILNIDKRNKRISVGYKQLQENPWEKLKKEFKEGDVLETHIVRIADKFIIVSILDDINGIISSNDVDWKVNKQNLDKIFHVGEKIKFQISNIDFKNEKIFCSIKNILENPYIALKEKYPNGTSLSGTVIKTFNYGVLTQIEGEFVGLLPLNNIPKWKRENLSNHFKKNSVIDIIVDMIDEKLGKIIFSSKGVYEKHSSNVQIGSYVEKEENVKKETFSLFSNLKDML